MVRRFLFVASVVGLVVSLTYVVEPVAEAKPVCRGAKCSTSTTTSSTTTSSTTTSSTTTPAAAALWVANANTDTDYGDQTRCMDKNTGTLPTDRLSIVTDPAGVYGKVYRAFLSAADISSGQKRAEWHKSFANCDSSTNVWLWSGTDQTRFVGWRSMFGGIVTLNGASNGGNYFQWKGDSTCGGPAVGVTISYNRLTIRTIDGDYLAWTGPLMSSLLDGRWHDMVMGVGFSKTNGWVEFWLDGVRQVMSDGTYRFEGPTVCPNDARVWFKAGTYGMDSGAPVHWLESPRIGTSLESVVPR